ncbi:MAG: type VI secretion system protein TssA [Alphaproteobacteria bacterium]|nr:MAG: type VI secretion system protein TssA [Alphaproteobacteria bacterium]
MDLDALLAPVDDDAPCGPDLEYDADFIALEDAARGKEEQQVGDQIIASEEPDYKEVEAAALELLGRTKDIRIAVILAEAGLRLHGPVALAQVLEYVRRCLEQYWECLHPELDAEDDDDPTMRVNAALGLADNDTVLRALRLAPLTDSRLMGRFSLRDILIANGEIEPRSGEDAPDPAAIAGAFEDTDAGHKQALRAAVKTARAELKAIDAIFSDKVGAQGPDLAPLDKLLYRLSQTLDTYAGGDDAGAGEAAPGEDGAGPDEAEAVPAGDGPAAAARSAPGTVNNADDVLRAIDRICDYYARREPSSPVPLILKRARRLVNADFTTIIKDIANDGYDQVARLGGLDDDDE